MPLKQKYCGKCHTTKTLETDFHKNKSREDGHEPYCKMCRRAIQRKNRMPIKCLGCGRDNILIQMHNRDTWKPLHRWICGWCNIIWVRHEGVLVKEADDTEQV